MNKITWCLFLAVFLGTTTVDAALFHHAVKNGDTALALSILAKGEANIDDKDDNSWTALMWAAFHGKKATITALLTRGANIEAKDNWGQTALVIASWDGNGDTVEAIREWLIENQKSITNPNDLKILNGHKPGSYELRFKSYGTKEQRKAEIERVTKIPTSTRGPGKHIMEYLGEE